MKLPAARKGSVQIRFEILEYLYFAPVAQPRTHVWRKATTLSYDDFQKHLALPDKLLLLRDSLASRLDDRELDFGQVPAIFFCESLLAGKHGFPMFRKPIGYRLSELVGSIDK